MHPIPASRCIAGRELSEPRLTRDGAVLVYGESLAGDSGFVVHRFDGTEPVRLLPTPALRAPRGMGGGSWCFTVDEQSIVYVAADGNLWLLPLDGRPASPVTHHGPERGVVSPCVSPDGTQVVYVVDVAEVYVVDLATCTSRRLDDGRADFCIDPQFTADAFVEWVEWDVPDMPWDRSRVHRVRADGSERSIVQPPHSIQQLRTAPDGRRASVRDDFGWWNVFVDDVPVVAESFEHAGPTWGPGQRTFAWSPSGDAIAFTRNESGFGRLCVVDVRTGVVRAVARGVHGQVSWGGHRVASLRSGACTPTQIAVYDTDTWERDVVSVGPSPTWSDDEMVEPEAVEVPVDDGVVHARLYPAGSPARGLIVWTHGGPTDQWQVSFMPRIAFWCSRGWNVLVPDHRGSTGHGRAYTRALRGRWGDLDVSDTVAVTRWAHARGWGEPSNTVAMGGSSGGFTALGSVAASPELFAAAAVAYPVTDLADLPERSHRYERHYTVS
ncbi:MAG: prolyl oligopeptidase family serine peptidase, partial [Actinomycetota bacterium]